MTRNYTILPLAGILRAYSHDFHRLQRIVDPFFASVLFWFFVLSKQIHPTSIENVLAMLLVGSATFVVFGQFRIYHSYRQSSLFTLLRRLCASWLLVFALLVSLAYALKTSAYYSRLAIVSWSISGLLLFIFFHLIGRMVLRFYRVSGGNTRALVYWGSCTAAMQFYKRLQNSPYLGLRMVAWFGEEYSSESLPPGMPAWGGSLSDLRAWLIDNKCDQLVFSECSSADIPISSLIILFGDLCVPVAYAPGWFVPGMRFEIDRVSDQPCITLWRPHDSLLDRQLKRACDLIFASLSLFFLSPLLLLIAVCVCLTSPGPALFWQDRYGLDGRRFRIVKFRTMRVQEPGDQGVLLQASRCDLRVTPLGRILRRWSLDELPQLWNVLIGNMSLVGPRPHAVAHNEHYRALIPGYMQRHLFKPGITGLAQVQGLRGETATLDAMQRRVAADLCYQRDWTLAGDFKILLQTLLQLRSNNAY